MFVFAFVFVFLLFTPIAEPKVSEKGVTYERTPWAFRHFVLGAIAIFVYVGVEVGIPATLIDYLKNSMDFETAGFIAGIYWLLMLVGRFVGSAIGGNVSSKTMVVTVSAAAIVLIVAAMFLGNTITVPFIGDWKFTVVQIPIAALLLVLCGLCTSIMWGCIFNLAVEGLGKYTAKASGIFMMMVVGGGIVPLIQSAVAGQFGEMISYIVPLLGVSYILFYALFGSKNVNKDIPTE
jgi:FHS family L-fucose permease-like MFS transporter